MHRCSVRMQDFLGTKCLICLDNPGVGIPSTMVTVRNSFMKRVCWTPSDTSSVIYEKTATPVKESKKRMLFLTPYNPVKISFRGQVVGNISVELSHRIEEHSSITSFRIPLSFCHFLLSLKFKLFLLCHYIW